MKLKKLALAVILSATITTTSEASYGGSSGGSRSSGSSYSSNDLCNRPVFTKITPSKNSVVNDLSKISFNTENSKESSIKVSVNGVNVPVSYNNGNVQTLSLSDIEKKDKNVIKIEAESSSDCIRSYSYIVFSSKDNQDNTDPEIEDTIITEPKEEKIKSNKVFNDVEGHWSESYVVDFAEKGIINGYGETNNFLPDNTITRAEALKIVLLDNGKQIEEKNNNPWYNPYIKVAITAGIINNTPRPNDNITRAEALAVVARSKGIKTETSSKNNFNDVDPISWYFNIVNWAYEKGIVKGYNDSSFKPNDKITRAEFIKIASSL